MRAWPQAKSVDAWWAGNILAATSAVGRSLMIRREITTPTDRLFSRRRFIYYSAALAAAVACGPAAAPATGSPTGSPAGVVQLKGTKVNLLHWTSFVPDEDKWFKETLVNDWAKPNGVDLTVELVSANEAQPKIVAALQAGGGPDVMLLQWTWSHLYADKLSDVSTIAEKVGKDGGGFYDAMKQNAQVQGTWRAVPFDMERPHEGRHRREDEVEALPRTGHRAFLRRPAHVRAAVPVVVRRIRDGRERQEARGEQRRDEGRARRVQEPLRQDRRPAVPLVGRLGQQPRLRRETDLGHVERRVHLPDRGEGQPRSRQGHEARAPAVGTEGPVPA